MTAAERYAVRVLIDRAKRAKLVADGVRAGHGARLHGDIAIGQARKARRVGAIAPARMSGSRRPYMPIAEDEQLLAAREIEHGVESAGYMLPSDRGVRVAAQMPSQLSVVGGIWEYTDDLDNVRIERKLRDADAMIRTLDEIRALTETTERSQVMTKIVQKWGTKEALTSVIKTAAAATGPVAEAMKKAASHA